MEDSPGTTTRERDPDDEMDAKAAFTKADNRRPGSSSLEVSTSKPNPSPPHVCIIDEQPRQSTPPSVTQVVSTDKEDKCKVEVDDHEMDVEMMNDEDDVTIVPPITTIPNPVVKPDAEQDIQLIDGSRIFKEEQESQSDLEMQRQRQRQALRGPTPCSSPQSRSRKTSLVVSKTGVKRDREEYEEGQVDEDDFDHDEGIDEPGIILEETPKESPVHESISTETQAIVADADAADDDDDDDSEEEIVILERELKDDKPKRQKDKKVSTDGRQVIPQTEMKKSFTGKGPNPKAQAKRSHYKDFINPPMRLKSFVNITSPQQQQQQFIPPPSPQSRLPKKLGINHMDLLYKTEREVMVCRFCL